MGSIDESIKLDGKEFSDVMGALFELSDRCLVCFVDKWSSYVYPSLDLLCGFLEKE